MVTNPTILPLYPSTGHTKHHKLFILVHMKLVAKVVSMVGYWIQLPCCSCPAGMLVDRTGPLKSLPYPFLADTEAL